MGPPNGHLRQAPQSTSWEAQGFTQQGQPIAQAVVGQVKNLQRRAPHQDLLEAFTIIR